MNFEKLGNIFPVIRNGANIKQDKVTDGYPITRIETIADGTLDLTRVGYASIHDESFSEYYLQENDILMSHINSVSHLGKVALVNQLNEKVIHGMNLLCLKANVSRIDPIYSFYFLKSPIFRSKIRRITKKSVNQASFNISNLKDIEIPVPSLPDQLYIANLLSKAENLITQRKESIRLLDEFLKSTFLEMFGDPTHNPKNWQAKRLDEISTRITDGKHGDCVDEANSGYYFLSAKDLNDGKLKYTDVREITQSDFIEVHKRTDLKLNDILLGNTGASIGKIGIVVDAEKASRTTFQKSISIITLKTDLAVPLYLKMYLSLNRKIFNRTSTGSAMTNLLLSQIRAFNILLPPIEFQTQFAQIVEKTEVLKTQYQQSLQELENLYGSLSQKAFRGELKMKQNV